ncbi:hypothetical protein IHE44_0015006 [Lamprotornis superbus]|uniref:Uncharacterized protein n=1 Tax=Lamprotornis superbus TaxID=245042 RepID=A0A835TW81_9PASS|nr:hypothetical protein IHE44_0015006 [Lamprotornis superbus]
MDDCTNSSSCLFFIAAPLIVLESGILIACCKDARDFVAFLNRVTRYKLEYWKRFSNLLRVAVKYLSGVQKCPELRCTIYAARWNRYMQVQFYYFKATTSALGPTQEKTEPRKNPQNPWQLQAQPFPVEYDRLGFLLNLDSKLPPELALKYANFSEGVCKPGYASALMTVIFPKNENSDFTKHEQVVDGFKSNGLRNTKMWLMTLYIENVATQYPTSLNVIGKDSEVRAKEPKVLRDNMYPSSLLAESFEVTAVGAVVAAGSLARCVMNLDMGTQQSRGPWLDEASRTGEVRMITTLRLRAGINKVTEEPENDMKLDMRFSKPAPMFLDDSFRKWARIRDFVPPFGIKGQDNLIKAILSATKDYRLTPALDRLSCRRCIIVGNGGVLANKSLGLKIDDYDVVVSFFSASEQTYGCKQGRIFLTSMGMSTLLSYSKLYREVMRH